MATKLTRIYSISLFFVLLLSHQNPSVSQTVEQSTNDEGISTKVVYFPLNHIEPRDGVGLISKLIDKNKNLVFSVDPRRRGIWAKGTEANLDLVKSILSNSDVPIEESKNETQLKVFTLMHLAAEDATNILFSLFDNSNKPVRFSIDARTNSVVASGTKEDLSVIEALLKRLDVDPESKNSTPRSVDISENCQVRIFWIVDFENSGLQELMKNNDSLVLQKPPEKIAKLFNGDLKGKTSIANPVLLSDSSVQVLVESKTMSRFQIENAKDLYQQNNRLKLEGTIIANSDETFTVELTIVAQSNDVGSEIQTRIKTKSGHPVFLATTQSINNSLFVIQIDNQK